MSFLHLMHAGIQEFPMRYPGHSGCRIPCPDPRPGRRSNPILPDPPFAALQVLFKKHQESYIVEFLARIWKDHNPGGGGRAWSGSPVHAAVGQDPGEVRILAHTCRDRRIKNPVPAFVRPGRMPDRCLLRNFWTHQKGGVMPFLVRPPALHDGSRCGRDRAPVGVPNLPGACPSRDRSGKIDPGNHARLVRMKVYRSSPLT